MKICADKKSFHGFNQEQLKSHLEAIELKKIYGLNPLATEFVPKVELWSPSSVPPTFPASPQRAPLPPRMPPVFFPPVYGHPERHPFPPIPPGMMMPPYLPFNPELIHPALLPYMMGPMGLRPPAPLIPRPMVSPLSQASFNPLTLNPAMFPPLPPPAVSAPGHLIPGVPTPGPQGLSPSDVSSLLPSSVSLDQMRKDPVLTRAWYEHLAKSGLDAEAFLHLLSSGNSEMPSTSQQKHGEPQIFATLHATKPTKIILFDLHHIQLMLCNV